MKHSCSITLQTKRNTEMTMWRDYSDMKFVEALDRALDATYKEEKLIKVKVTSTLLGTNSGSGAKE